VGHGARPPQVLGEEQRRAAGAGPGAAPAAHVIAPCPHDGGCPMDGTGSWCHFAQRFQRSGLGVGAKTRPGGGRARTYQAGPGPRLARTRASFTYATRQCSFWYARCASSPAHRRTCSRSSLPTDSVGTWDVSQDERFSYVVLRRAPRPPLPADVRVARARDGEAPPPPEDPAGLLPRAWRQRAAAAEAAAAAARAETLEGLLDAELGDGADADSEGEEDEEDAALERALRELMVGSVRGSDDEDEAGAAGAADAKADVAIGRAGGPSAALAAELAAELEAARAARGAAAAARRRGGPRPGPPALGPGSRGGCGEEAEAEDGGEAQGRRDVREPESSREARRDCAAAAEAEAERAEAADADEEEEGDEEEDRDAEEWRSSEDVWRERDAPALAAAAAAAAGWARIVRPPRKRSGHVVLDLCTAARRTAAPDGDAASGGGAGPELGSGSGPGLAGRGKLVQQVVAAADKRAWLGPAGYRLARKARWGDLWPRWYEDRAITVRGGLREPQEGQ